MRRLLTVLCLSLGLPALAPAQCPFQSVSLQPYATACARVTTTPPTLGAKLDTQNCQLNLTVTAWPGCCNTYLTARLLILGAQQIKVPIPGWGSGCGLWAQPDVVLVLASSGGDTFSLPIPAGLSSPFSFPIQGGAIYFTTIGFTTDVALTTGAVVNLR